MASKKNTKAEAGKKASKPKATKVAKTEVPSADAADVQATTTALEAAAEQTAVTTATARRAKRKPEAPKKLSALNAAAKVLEEACQPMNCQELIAAMAAKNYWSSPTGKTPHATLYAAILREITIKGTDARFVKTERGMFALRTSV